MFSTSFAHKQGLLTKLDVRSGQIVDWNQQLSCSVMPKDAILYDELQLLRHLHDRVHDLNMRLKF